MMKLERKLGTCGGCDGIGKVRRVDPMDNSYYRTNCLICGGTGVTNSLDRGKEECAACEPVAALNSPGCEKCNHTGLIEGSTRYYPCPHCEGPSVDPEGRLIRAAGDVMRAQRIKGIAKYKSTLEDQNGYTVGGMIDMVAEELAGGSVYVQKVREMYLALLDEIVATIDMNNALASLNNINNIIERERGNV